ncbi:MAG: nuclear transport factor 2 family protein [Telluria sp.]
MREQDNIALVRQGYDAYSKGDLPRLLSMFSRDIDWDMPEIEGVPFTGKRHGIDAVGECFRLMDESQQAREFKPDEFIGQGDKVLVLGHCTFYVKATGREFSSDFCHVFRISGDKVTSFKEYDDSYAAAKAYQADIAGIGATGTRAEPRPSVH